MARRLLTLAMALAALSAAAPRAASKEWANKLFNETRHDFGVVARGANVEHRFTIENVYVEDVHIASVTSTCGCTTPKLLKDTLKTYETTELVALLDTRRFTGQKEATLKVVFDRPFAAEVQLHVTSYIRSDVVFEPGSVQFGTVGQGRTASQRVTVNYAGRKDWQVVDVASNCQHLAAELREVARLGETPAAKVEYELVLSLKETAPPGYLKEQVTLKTNDPNRQTAQVPLTVEAHVIPALSISPASLMLGVRRPGQPWSGNLVVRGDKPFRITQITGPDARFQFAVPEAAKPVHFVPVTFTADAAAGRVTGKIRVETDMPGAAPLEVLVEGQVVAAAAPETPASSASP